MIPEYIDRTIKQKSDAMSELSRRIYDAKRILYFELPNTKLTDEELEIDENLRKALSIIESRYWLK